MLTSLLIAASFPPSVVRLPCLRLIPPPVSGYHPLSPHFFDYPISFLHLQTCSSTGSFPSSSFSLVSSAEYSPSPPEGGRSTPLPKGIWRLAHHCTLTALAEDADIYLWANSSRYSSLLILVHSSSSFHTVNLSLTGHSQPQPRPPWFSSCSLITGPSSSSACHSNVDSLGSLLFSLHTPSHHFGYHLYYRPTPLSQAPEPWNPPSTQHPHFVPLGPKFNKSKTEPSSSRLKPFLEYVYDTFIQQPPLTVLLPHIHIKFLTTSTSPSQSPSNYLHFQ